MTWSQSWTEFLALTPDLPPWVIATLAIIFLYGVVVVPSAVVFNYLDRKITADIQARVGVNRAGYHGIGQFLADLLKLLEKGITRDRGAPSIPWFSVHTMALYSTIAALPIGGGLILLDTDMSALIPVWSCILLALGTMLLGLDQRTVTGGFAGLRQAAQALAGSFPATVAIIAAAIKAGGFQWSAINMSQGSWPHQWTVFSDPFSFVAFWVFLAGGLILLSVAPFDSALSPAELAGGVSSGVAGRRLTLFWFGRFYGFFFWAAMTAVLFLGGWNIPGGVRGLLQELGGPNLVRVAEMACLVTKSFFVMVSWILVARVIPRLRSDQITGFAWKVLCPASLLALAGVAIWVTLGSG
jgi:NADH-quinone oxidoreductase subunit H